METKKISIDEMVYPVIVTEKPLVVKEWFAAKKFYELKRTRLFSNNIFAIYGETEKAYHCLVGDIGSIVATWVPKSLVEVDTYEGRKRSSFVCESYEEARSIFDNILRYYA